MNKIYGYDPETTCLVSWDGEFLYEGKTDSPPQGTHVAIREHQTNKLAACHFLSGNSLSAFYHFSDKGEKFYAFGNALKGVHGWNSWKTLTGILSVPLCVCGDIAGKPGELGEICRMFPCAPVYVCHLMDELVAFGVLARVVYAMGHKPRRFGLARPNTEELDGWKYDQFDDKLEGDGLGRMADVVSKGMPVWNQMMDVPGISPFYGKTITKAVRGDGVFLLRRSCVERCFGSEPISLKHYAAQHVPVRVANTEEFKKTTGCGAEFVDIVASSEHIPGLPDYLRFHTLMSKKDFAFSSVTKEDFNAWEYPVFRYNKAYHKWR